MNRYRVAIWVCTFTSVFILLAATILSPCAMAALDGLFPAFVIAAVVASIGAILLGSLQEARP